jgi:hypothetical protein
MALCGGLLAFSSPVYSGYGTVAPTYTFTAATTGQEVGYFYGTTAGDTDLLGVWDNGVQLGTWALNNHTTAVGTPYNFGQVNAGDTIVFALYDQSRNDTVYSDPAMNADGLNHTYTTAFSGSSKNGMTIPAGTFVAFEDLLRSQHSDFNYNDEDVVFSDLTATLDPPAAPEPSTLLLLGLGLAGTAVGLRRKKSA